MTENAKLENDLRGNNDKFNDPWRIKIDALIDWYSNIFTEKEIMDGFKELQNNHYVYFDAEEVLLNERMKINE